MKLRERIAHGAIVVAILAAAITAACTKKVLKSYGSYADMPTDTFTADLHETEVIDGTAVFDGSAVVTVIAVQQGPSYNYAGILAALTENGATINNTYKDMTWAALGIVFTVTTTGALDGDGNGSIMLKEVVDGGSTYVFTYELSNMTPLRATIDDEDEAPDLFSDRVAVNRMNARNDASNKQYQRTHADDHFPTWYPAAE